MRNSNLRVLFIVDAIQGRNGVGTYFQDLANQLRSSVERVELVAPNLVDSHPIQGLSFPMPGDSTQRLFLPKLNRLINLAEEMQPNVIVIPGPGIFSMAGLWLAERLSIPVCMTHQTDYPNLVAMYWRGPHGLVAKKTLNWLNKFMACSSANVVTISDGMREQLRSLGVTKPYLVGTSLSQAFLSEPAPQNNDKIRNILFLGRLAAEKNIAQFLDLAVARPDLNFTIAGDGPLRDDVIQKQREIKNLSFLGWRKRETIPALIDDHDLLILPSSVEAFGTVALETMARERLVMTTSSCGINEWDDLKSGIVVLEANENLSSGLQRIESMTQFEKKLILKCARKGALNLVNNCTSQWLEVLSLTAAKGSEINKNVPSPTYSLIKRYIAA